LISKNRGAFDWTKLGVKIWGKISSRGKHDAITTYIFAEGNQLPAEGKPVIPRVSFGRTWLQIAEGFAARYIRF
jgi:hypothetical protein